MTQLFAKWRRSVAFGEDHGVLSRPPAINTGVSDGGLVEGKGSCRRCGLGFDCVLTFTAAAPHGFDEALFVEGFGELVHVVAGDDVGAQEL